MPPPLGTLCWYSVASDAEIAHDRLRATAAEVGIATRLPTRPDPYAAFRKVCAETTTDYLLRRSMRAHIRLRPLRAGEDQAVRRLVREITDPRSGQLFVDEVGEAIYQRPARIGKARGDAAGLMRVTLDRPLLADYEVPLLEAFADQLRERFSHYCRTVDADAIRDMVRRSLLDLPALRLSPTTGVYFVPDRVEAAFERLQRLAIRIGATLLGVPVHGDAGPTLAKAAAEQLTHDARMLGENLEAVIAKRGRHVTPGIRSDYHARTAQLLARIQDAADAFGMDPEPVAELIEPVLARLDEHLEVARGR